MPGLRRRPKQAPRRGGADERRGQLSPGTHGGSGQAALCHYQRGQASNIVPAEAEVWCFGRSPSSEELQSLWKLLNKIAQGVALMTETEVSELLGGCYNTLQNKV